jgi:hypothetical protein
MVGRMRLISDRAVTDAAKQVEDTIIKTYLRPNRSFQEFVDYAHKGGMELLTEFGEAARKDLAAHANAERWNASADRQDIVVIRNDRSTSTPVIRVAGTKCQIFTMRS